MKTTFLHQNYAVANPDLAEQYGAEDTAALQAHFETYGAAERRGVELSDYVFAETVLMSEDGHIFLSGWADRRMLDTFAVTVIVGYVMYEFGQIDVCWYDRRDIGETSGDTARPSCFFLALKMDDFRIHSDVVLTINGKKLFATDTMRWMSPDKFLFDAMAHCAPVTSWPIGDTLELAQSLVPGFGSAWASYRAGLHFVPVHASPQVRWQEIAEEVTDEITEEITEEIEEEIPQAVTEMADDPAEMPETEPDSGSDPEISETAAPAADEVPPPLPETVTRTVTRHVSRTVTRTVTRSERRVDRAVRTSILITLYRATDLLLPQLELLAPALEGADKEVIVVINAPEGEPNLLTERLAAFGQMHDIALTVYACAGNAGFAAANNFAADQALGEVLIFMNPDIFPPEGQAEQALAFLDGDPGEGLDGALLYYGDGLLMHSGMYTTADPAANPRTGFSAPVLRVEHYGKGLTARVDDDAATLAETLRDVPEDGLLVTAALWRIRREVFDEMGGLSTDYILAYYEDADFCLRMRQAGRPVRLDRSSRWLHLEGAGAGAPEALRTAMWLNRALYSDRFAGSDHLAPALTDLTRL
ncbi:MAG: glycosyltransferase family 2 protein [Marinibacterium sp.]